MFPNTTRLTSKECHQCKRMIPKFAEICMHCGVDVGKHNYIKEVEEIFHGFFGVVLSGLALAGVAVYLVAKYYF